MTKFVIFTTPRTGSTLLIKTLDTHPEIMCAGEIFFFKGAVFHNECRYHFIKVPFIGNKLNYVVNYPFIWLKLKEFLNKFFNTNSKGEKARGFKLMHYQTYYLPGIFDYLKSNDIKVIVLIRKNVLRNTLSDLRARSTGVYHNAAGVNVNAIPKFKVDIDELGKKMKEIEGFNRQLEKTSAGLNSRIFYYEDFENWGDTIGQIQRFIGVKEEGLKAASRKLNPERLEDMMENYAEVKQWLSSNGYAQYLD